MRRKIELKKKGEDGSVRKLREKRILEREAYHLISTGEGDPKDKMI